MNSGIGLIYGTDYLPDLSVKFLKKQISTLICASHIPFSTPDSIKYRRVLASTLLHAFVHDCTGTDCKQSGKLKKK
jgi:hypothetical protein